MKSTRNKIITIILLVIMCIGLIWSAMNLISYAENKYTAEIIKQEQFIMNQERENLTQIQIPEVAMTIKPESASESVETLIPIQQEHVMIKPAEIYTGVNSIIDLLERLAGIFVMMVPAIILLINHMRETKKKQAEELAKSKLATNP